MLNIKLDIKMWFIIILGGLLILSLIFRPSKDVEIYEDEIEQLKENNRELDSENDSLELVNNRLSREVDTLLSKIDNTEQLLEENNDKIKQLKDEKDKISNHVRSLDANGVANSLTDYLNRKEE